MIGLWHNRFSSSEVNNRFDCEQCMDQVSVYIKPTRNLITFNLIHKALYTK